MKLDSDWLPSPQPCQFLCVMDIQCPSIVLHKFQGNASSLVWQGHVTCCRTWCELWKPYSTLIGKDAYLLVQHAKCYFTGGTSRPCWSLPKQPAAASPTFLRADPAPAFFDREATKNAPKVLNRLFHRRLYFSVCALLVIYWQATVHLDAVPLRTDDRGCGGAASRAGAGHS